MKNESETSTVKWLRKACEIMKKKTATAGDGQSALAEAIGVKQQRLWWWLNRSKHPMTEVPPEYCRPIEEATEGKVPRWRLRPDCFDKPQPVT